MINAQWSMQMILDVKMYTVRNRTLMQRIH